MHQNNTEILDLSLRFFIGVGRKIFIFTQDVKIYSEGYFV